MTVRTEKIHRPVRNDLIQKPFIRKRLVTPVCDKPSGTTDPFVIRMGLGKFFYDLYTFRLGTSFSQIRTHISAAINCSGKKMGMCIQERGHNHFFSVIVKRPVCIILISLEIPGKNCLDLFVLYRNGCRSGEIFKTCKNSFTSQNKFSHKPSLLHHKTTDQKSRNGKYTRNNYIWKL